MLIGTWDLFDRKINGRWVIFGSKESDRVLSGLLDEAITALSSAGASVALLTKPYDAPPFTGPYAVVKVPRYGSSYDRSRVDHWNSLLRAAAARHRSVARVIDLQRFASPHGPTENIHGVHPFRGDGTHFTAAGADVVAAWLLPQLAATAQLHRPAPPA